MPLHKTVTYYVFLINNSNVLKKKLELAALNLEEAREEFLALPLGAQLSANSKLWAYISPVPSFHKAKSYWSEVAITEKDRKQLIKNNLKEK